MPSPDAATPAGPRSDHVNLRRVVKMLLVLTLAMGLAWGLCAAVKPPDTGPRGMRAVAFPQGMAPLASWASIVIHRTPALTRPPAASDHDRGIAYHFLIARSPDGESPDGESLGPAIVITPRWRTQSPAGAADVHAAIAAAVNIALVGDFADREPSDDQLDALAELVATLAARLKIPADRVLLHDEIEAADCPGRAFPMSEFLRRLCEHYRTGPNI